MKKAFFIKTTVFVVVLLSSLSVNAQKKNTDVSNLKKKVKIGDPASQYQLGKVYENGLMGEKVSLKKAIDLYEKSALQRYDSALFTLGNLYSNGKGLEKNDAIALTYYKSAAQTGHAEAAYKAGESFEKGRGTKPNAKETVKFYLIAFANGYEDALGKLDNLPVAELAETSSPAYIKYQEHLNEKAGVKASTNPEKDYEEGYKFETGRGAKRSLKKAYELYKRSADAGYSKAQLSLGLMYARGVYVPQNNRLAVKYLLQAANQGDLAAKAELRKFNLKQFSDVNSKEYLIYQAENGDPDSQFQLYKNYLHGSNGFEQNFDKAMEYCQKAALQDHISAIMTLGSLYQRGGFKVPPNPEIAFLWFRKAAYLGNDSASYMLGEFYAKGLGVEENEERAVRWYLQAANQGNKPAFFMLSEYDVNKYIKENDLEFVKYKAAKGNTKEQLKLGKYYYRSNDPQAVKWLEKAAEGGEVQAQNLLGEIYFHGKCNMPVNYAAAANWYTKAADKNDLESVRQLAYVYSKNLTGERDNFLEKAFQRANQYLRLASKDTTTNPAIEIYRILGSIYENAQDYKNAIIYYTEYINLYEEGADEPLHLVETIEQRAKSYFALEKYISSATDAEIALVHLENFKSHISIKPNYRYIYGLLNYLQGKAVVKLDNQYKACKLFQRARVSGVVIDSQFDQYCMN